MKKEFMILMLLMASFSMVVAQTNFEIYYKLNLDYSYGDITINSTEIEFSQEKIENYFGFYAVEVLDYGGKTLNTISFNVPNIIIYDTVDSETGEISGGGLLELNETSFEIFVPYYENAKEIVIYDQNLTQLVKKDMSEYSKERNISEKIVSKEEKADSTGEKISEGEKFIEKVAGYWWILLITLTVLIIILFYSLSKKK